VRCKADNFITICDSCLANVGPLMFHRTLIYCPLVTVVNMIVKCLIELKICTYLKKSVN
jgi:hypothetical protein